MAFKQLFIRRDKRRLDNPSSAFICVHLRLKNTRNDFYCQHLSAPICGLNPFHSTNLRFIEPNRIIGKRIKTEILSNERTQYGKEIVSALLQRELSWSHFKELKVGK